MQLPDIPVNAQLVIDEYHSRLSNFTAANIRLTLMVAELVTQRDDALNRWAEADANGRMWEQRYSELENGRTSVFTPPERGITP